MSTFGEGFAEGIRGGAILKESWDRGREQRAEQEVAALLSEAENWNPNEDAFDPEAQGVPEEGQPAVTQRRGGSGLGLADINKRYFDAAGKLDLDGTAKAKAAWGVMQHARVQQAGYAAIAAYDRGDMDGAARMVDEASSFMSPGYTTQTRVDPKTGGFVLATYDRKGNPANGKYLTRDQLVDLVNLNNDPQAWANSEHDEAYQKAQTDLAYKRYNSEDSDRRARLELARTQEDRLALQAQATLANSNLDNILKGLQITEAERKVLEEGAQASQDAILGLITYNKTQADAYKAEHGAGYTYATDPVLIDYEGSNNWAAVGPETKYGRARGRAQFIEARFNEAKAAGAVKQGMTFEEFGSDTPEGQEAQINAEAWHWKDIDESIIDMGLDDYLGQMDANGNEITWAGLRFAMHSGGPGGAEAWIKRGDPTVDVNGKGPADYIKLGLEATPVGPDAARAAQEGVPTEGGAVDEAGAFIDDDGKPKPDVYATNPWWFEPPNANGEVYKRKNIWEGAGIMSADLERNNPDASRDQIASLTVDAFGEKPRGQVILGEGDEPNYYTDGVSKLLVSPEVAEMVNAFTITNADLRAKFEQQNNPQPYTVYDQGEGEQEQAIPAPAPAPAPMPAPAAPGAAAAAAPPPQAAIPEPGAQPGPPPTVDSSAVRTGGVPQVPVPPEVSGQPAPPRAGDPFDLVRPHQPPPLSQYGAQVPLPNTIAQVPELATAVRAWMTANLAPGGPEEQAVQAAISQLPPNLQPQVMRELEMVMRMRRQ